MNTSFYLKEFQKAADQLDEKLLNEKGIEVAVVVILDSVCLKLYKKSWASGLQDPLTAESRIFFSVWVNDATIEAQKVSYNIHALKLRHLKGYAIQSHQFAAIFRESFKAFEAQWPNVSVKYGPLTLMEGWVKLDQENLQHEVLALANNFLEIGQLVDNTLLKFKR